MDAEGTEDIPAEVGAAEAGALQPLEYQPVNAPEGQGWKAGTLTYTTAGLVILFCWLLWGDFAFSLKERSVPQVLQTLLRKYHASDTLLGALTVVLPQIITIVLGPLVSFKSDRHRGPWGRRIPFLVLATPIAVIAMIGLSISPWLGAHFGRGENQSTLLFFAIFWTCFEVSTITANAVFGALANDVVPKAVIGTFFGLFRALSLIAGIIFNYWIFGQAEWHYKGIFIGMAIIYGVGFTLMCLKVKEGKYPPPSPVDQDRPASPLLAAKGYFRDCFTKSYYYWVFAAVVLPNLAFLPINTFNLFFSRSVNMSADRYGKLMAFYFGISLVQTVPLGWLADKFHPLRVAMVALILHGAASLWGGIFIHGPVSFGIAYVATGTLSGTWFTATAALTMALLPKMKYAQYFSALQMINSVLFITFMLCMGPFLDWTGHVYRYTYYAGFYLDMLGLIATFVVFQKFLALGGTKHYVAPE